MLVLLPRVLYCKNMNWKVVHKSILTKSKGEMEMVDSLFKCSCEGTACDHCLITTKKQMIKFLSASFQKNNVKSNLYHIEKSM